MKGKAVADTHHHYKKLSTHARKLRHTLTMYVTDQHIRELLDGSECRLQGAGVSAAAPGQPSAVMIAIQNKLLNCFDTFPSYSPRRTPSAERQDSE